MRMNLNLTRIVRVLVNWWLILFTTLAYHANLTVNVNHTDRIASLSPQNSVRDSRGGNITVLSLHHSDMYSKGGNH